MALVTFWLLTAVILTGAIWVVALRNLFRAALSLGLVLIGVAGLFLLLEAEFLAFVQILIYVGAILTLIVFAIMLTAKLHGSADVAPSRQQRPALAVSLGLFAVLTATTQLLAWPTTPSGDVVTAAALGQQFMTQLVLPFEVVSLVFVAAMVGAIAVAARRSRPGAS